MKIERLTDQSCRSILARLDQRGDLLTLEEPVDAHHEVAAVLSLVDARRAVRFASIRDHETGIFAGILSDLDRIAMVLGVPAAEIQDRLIASISRPVAPQIVEAAPVQEVVRHDNVLSSLPVPWFFARETGPYITAGLIVARDPETGLGNASYARLKVLGPSEALIGIAPNHHLSIMARKAAARGETLPFAVVLGAHPAIQLAACFYLGLGDDEIHCAGALLGEPVRLVKARTSDLLVPAEAEIVLEGEIHADDIIVEGLVSEYHGMYEDYGTGVRATFGCQTRRADAMLQVIEPGYHAEHLYLGAVPIAASLRAQLARVIPNVGQVAVTLSGSGRTNVVVQIDRPRPGQAKRAMMACWSAVSIVKNVTVVDVDIDPWDLAAVELAKMNRMRAERDVLIVPGMSADRSEPQEERGMVTKTGYDATCKPGDRKEGFEPALPPPEAMERMRALLTKHHPELGL
ncbi:4-hydroxy-3-polyprenylbenzoate decarboxylase [Devosia enhydra]|uniref:4-hydroxy-3-polyprenylbenzoate decarboxylase n=1 Tax=Devosia enhydra TaxID=665118 RepID=A0A1K2HTL0_9HYPH|nr:UbiD family decarboxylase [Devosia enhydra]SFZ80629.1 4-hydroxy-3-polyprenylbenzoate decarboxylase [Devosia enhydra]